MRTCSQPGCDRPHYARGLCNGCYKAQTKAGTITPIRVGRGVCEYPNCGREHQARGYCSTHYQMLREGRPIVPIRRVTPPGDWPEIADEIDHSYLPLDVVLRDLDMTPRALERAAWRHGRPDIAVRAHRLIEALDRQEAC